MLEDLTPRESECLCLAGQGLEDKEIAASLGISPRTVSNHLHHAYTKLGVSDRKVAARKLSNHYSATLLPISSTAEPSSDAPASAGQSDDADIDRSSSCLLPAFPRGVLAQIGIMIVGSAIALRLAIGIVTAGTVVPTLF